QIQFRLAFTLLAATGLLQAIMKVAIVLVPWAGDNRIEAYAFSFFAIIFPSQWIGSIYLLRSKVPRAPEILKGWRSWIAPFLLSTAVAIMPQYDLVLMSHTQSSSRFEEFAFASLFYKGVYFVLFIVAQWLLPQQIQKKAEVRNLWLSVSFAVAFSIVLTLLSPLISTIILNKDHGPDAWLLLLSCLHMSLLTLTFLGIQQACADGRVWAAAIALLVIGLKGGLQFAAALDAPVYLVIAIAIELPNTLFLWRKKAGRGILES
ncbi:MAG: hypothetical protein AAB250_08275, partial [Bdellovibrionota bacterium]